MANSTGEGRATSEFPVKRFFRRLLYIMMPALAQKFTLSIEMLYALDGLQSLSDWLCSWHGLFLTGEPSAELVCHMSSKRK